MKIYLLSIAFILLFTGHTTLLLAQTRLSAVVRNKTGQTLEAATVLLHRQKDSSILRTAVTNRSGQFEFSKIIQGSYFLSVTSIGYENYTGDVLSVDSMTPAKVIADIILSPAAKDLRSVSVVTQRRFIEWKMDKVVVNVNSSPFFNPGQSALDVLERSPGLNIDYGNNTLSLNGRQGTTVYINGRISYLSGQDLINYLRGLPAGTLDQIELITQPSAKYDAAGSGGVVNIILKKNQADGLYGSFTTSAIVGYYFKTRDNIVLDWRKGRYNLNFAYGISDNRNFNDQHILSSFRAGYGSPFSQFQDYQTSAISKNISHTPRLSVDYQASKNTSLALNLTSLFSSNTTVTNGPIDLYDSLHHLTRQEEFINTTKSPVSNFGVNLDLQQKLDKKGKELSADADYIFYHSPGIQNSDNYHGLVPSQIDIYAFKSDYSQPFHLKHQALSDATDAKFEAGIKSSYVRTDNDASYTVFDTVSQKWQPDTALTNHFIYSENINAGYIDISEQLNKKWSVKLGVRAEQTISHGYEKVQNNRFRKNYFQLFPTAYIGYTPNDLHSFTLSYGRRMDRPGYVDLNPFRYIINQYSIREGNPSLQPEFVNNIEVTYHYKNDFTFWGNYVHINNMFSRVFKSSGQDNDLITIQTKENVQSRRNIFLFFFYNKTLTKWWNANWTIALINSRLTDPTNTGAPLDKVTVFRFDFNNQFPLGKGWGLDLRGNYAGRRLEGIRIYALASGSGSVGINKKLMKNKGLITMNINDPFSLYKPGQTSEAATFFIKTTNHPESRYLTMTFNYRFGSAKQQQRRKSDGSAEDEQRRANF